LILLTKLFTITSHFDRKFTICIAL